MVKKRKGSFKDSLIFLIGAFIYSILYWATMHNQAHIFGMILVALVCYLIDRTGKSASGKEWIKPRSVICLCAGAIFDSMSSGFPFGFIPM